MARKEERLVGRAAELRTLEGLLDGTCAGTSAVVFITGEPGIGKTQVLAELVRQAERRGCLVLEGNAAEFEQELPFGAVIDALDAFVESLDRHTVDRLAADGLEQLANVFPSLGSLRTTTASPSTAAERFRSYYAVRELLERLAAQQPVVLVLDDLHWADGASLELVAHLIRRRPEAPVLLAGSFRTGQAAPSLMTAIDTAERSGAVTCVELGPLARQDATALLPAAEASRSESLYLQSGGNPFYLLQLAKVDGTGPRRQRGGGPEVPAGVVAAISQELTKLSTAARSFAEAASVVGDPFELDLAALSAGVSEPAALAAVDELIACDLVHPSQVPRRFSFRHPLVRAAVYEAASTSTRLGAHGRCGAALAEQGAPATSRAHHLEHSARKGDEAAIAVLVEAGTQTAHRLPSSAAHWFQAALRLLPTSTSFEARADLVMAAASALTTAGRLVEAREVLLEGFASVPTDATDARVLLTAACAGIEQQIGRQDEAHARLLTALDELTDRGSEAGVSLMVALATDGFYQMRYDEMKDWGVAAVKAASELESGTLLAASYAVLATAFAFIGDTEAAARHCRAAAEIVDPMSDEELAVRLDAIGHLAAAELYLERFEETAAHAARGIAVARHAGRNDVFPTLFPCLGTAMWVIGRLSEAAHILDGAVEAARLSGNDQGLAWSLMNRSLAALMAGDLEVAMGASQEGIELIGSSETFVTAFVGTGLAWALHERGESAAAVEMMVASGGGEDLSRMPGGWRASYLEVLACSLLDVDDVERARTAAERAMALADEVGLPRTDAVAHRAVGEVALRTGDVERAVLEAEASVAAADGCSARLDAALSRMLLGRALAKAGDISRAVSALERAATDLDAFGALRHRDRAERELRRLGHRVHRRSVAASSQGRGIGSLSGRELEVVRLVVDRRTNSEIAADLFLSLKTVETHMRNIFRKLGVSSRVEVARLAEGATAG